MPGSRAPLSVDALTDHLRRLGVASGMAVMVHASLRALTPVDGGATGVIEAIDRAVGPDGTWLMVLGADDDWAWVNERPEAEREALLAEADPFDGHTTPAQPDVGVLAEIFRQAPGTLVSDHPEGRFGARGRMAAALVADVPWDDYYGPGSPLERLVDAGGHVLRLGADENTVTLLHYAEYLADLPHKRRVRRHRRVATPQGPVIRTVACLDDSHGIVSWPGEDYFSLILRAFLETSGAKRGQVGGARSDLIEARPLVAFGVRWMETHLTPHAGRA